MSTGDNQPSYLLPPNREYRFLRDFTFKQGLFLVCFVAVGIAFLSTGRLYQAVIAIAIGVLGCIGYGSAPGYMYPLRAWQSITHNANSGAIYNDRRQKLVVPLKPMGFGRIGTNLKLKTNEYIVYFDLGPAIHAADNIHERFAADRSFADVIADILSIAKDVTGFGFLVGQRPSDPRKAEAKYKASTVRNPVKEYPADSIAALRRTDYELFEKHVEAIRSGKEKVSQEQLELIWQADGDELWEDVADNDSERICILYFLVKGADEWDGIANEPKRYDPATLKTSVLQRVVDMAESLLPQAGFPKAAVRSFEGVCELDFRVWHVQTLAEAQLEQVAPSYDEHLDDDGNIDPWPTSVQTVADLLDTEGSFHAFNKTKANRFTDVAPGGLDHLLMSRSNPSTWLVNLRCYRVSTKRDQYFLRRQQARNGFMGFGTETTEEQSYQEKQQQKYKELDDLHRSGNGMIRWVRTEQISGNSVYDVEEIALPINTLSRWRSLRFVRDTGSFLKGHLADMLGS